MSLSLFLFQDSRQTSFAVVIQTINQQFVQLVRDSTLSKTNQTDNDSVSAHMLGYLEFTKSLLGLISAQEKDALDWSISSISTYKDLLKMVKQAG